MTVLRLLIALVWLANGVYAKILNGVPRHREIVAAILGDAYAAELTVAIGLGEVFIAIWVLSGRLPKTVAVLQIVGVLLMNVIEITLVPELLLWGQWNILFALAFVVLVYLHAFRWPR